MNQYRVYICGLMPFLGSVLSSRSTRSVIGGRKNENLINKGYIIKKYSIIVSIILRKCYIIT